MLFKRNLIFTCLLFVSIFFIQCSHSTLKKDLFRNTSLFQGTDSIKAVIEIPTYTRAKWEWRVDEKRFVWDTKKGKKRMIQYSFPYLFNYGMVPQTLGGDGDPLDILVLGEPLHRGTVLPVRVIGVLKTLDKGEVDDKIISVNPRDPMFGHIQNISDLRQSFPGTTEILEIWFKNYKLKPGKMVVQGIENQDQALKLVERAYQDYQTKDVAYSK